ncbi:MAG: methyltransferase domain-containing protein [bacterium]|nr:methyltransferase domain-containing protein [bacterium]
MRGFVGRWGALVPNSDGYCPRCNSKARHRRIWLYLEEHTDVLVEDLCVLEVAPWWALARRLQRQPNVRYVGLDQRRTGPQVTLIGDARSIPLESSTVDALLCVHVLEHVVEDQRAIAELFRVLRPGGWAVVSVPLRLDRMTDEDPLVTDPDERGRRFGERGHVRFYGIDLTERLEASGFGVRLHRASEVPETVRRECGLREDENVFHCTKPGA